ncbi:trypsin-like peptidase domain-containing protein [Glycomyces tarimensis]
MTPTDRLWSSDQRVVRIGTRKNGTGGPRKHSLTGYLVADELVLTCAHDVADAETHEVRCAGDGIARHAEVVWNGKKQVNPIDVALLSVPGLQTPKGRVVWGEYSDYVGAKDAWCIGFPRADKENDTYHAARVDGGFVPGEGSGRGKMLFTVNDANGAETAWWSGLSGAMVVDDKGLLGVVAQYEHKVRPRFHVVPASVILAQPRLRELIGATELLPLSDPHPLVRDPFESLGEETELKLITARYGQVPFVKESHGEALDKLMSWCLADSTGSDCDVSLRLLTGPAGAGKTRLAGELCRKVAESDSAWRAGFAYDDQQTPWGTHLPQTPLLVVFDYVERAAIAARVIALLRHLERLGDALRYPVRVLLVSRAAGGWYEQMTDHGGTLLQQRLRGEESPRIELSRSHFGPELRRTHFTTAYERFTAGAEGARGSGEFLDLVDGDQYDSPLLVHIAALLASRREILPVPERQGLRERLLGYLLRRERERRWDFAPALSTTKANPAQSDQALHAVAIMTLTAPTVREATEFLKASELWADQSNADRREAAKALVRLYPSESDANWRAAPIEPDLVSEYLVASVEDLPELLAALHDQPLGTEHYARMLHLLALTCDHYPGAVDHVYETLNRTFAKMVGEDGDPLMPEFLDQSLPKLIELAVNQVVEHGNEAVANILASMIERIDKADGVVEAIANTEFATRRDDERLARLGRVLYNLKIRHCQETDDRHGLVDALEGLAGAALAMGEVDEAFDSLTEAVRLRKKIGANLPSAWAFSALSRVCVRFSNLERYNSAITVARTVMDLHRAAGCDDLNSYREHLSIIESVASKLRQSGQSEAARKALLEAVLARRGLGMRDSGDYSFAIAELEALAEQELLSGSATMALQATLEALRLRRDFDQPDAYACPSDFERIETVFHLQQSADAADVTETAELLHWLAKTGVASYCAAVGLETIGRRMWWLGWKPEAVAALEAAVSIRRMPTPFPGFYRLDMVPLLRDCAMALWRTQQRHKALKIFQEIQTLTWEEASHRSDSRLRAVFAAEDLAAALWDMGTKASALQVMRQAESTERAVMVSGSAPTIPAHSDPRTQPFLPAPLADLEPLLRPEVKVEMLRMIAEDNLAAYSSLASALERLSEFQIVRGYDEAAVKSITEATEIWHKLANASPTNYSVRLRESLIAKGQMLLKANQPADAAAALGEVFESHAEAEQRRWLRDLIHGTNLEALTESIPRFVRAHGRAQVANALEKGH